jgi:hypothetical protein
MAKIRPFSTARDDGRLKMQWPIERGHQQIVYRCESVALPSSQVVPVTRVRGEVEKSQMEGISSIQLTEAASIQLLSYSSIVPTLSEA